MDRVPTRVVRYRNMQKQKNEDEEQFEIDWPISLFTIMMAIAMGSYTIILLQIEKGRLYDIAMQQNVMLSQSVFLILIAMAWITSKGNIRITVRSMWKSRKGFGDRDDIIYGLSISFIVFVIAKLVGFAYLVTLNELYGMNLGVYSVFTYWNVMSIVFTSAVYEELFYSLGIGLLCYLVIKKFLIYMIKDIDVKIAGYIAMVSASIIRGVLFAFMHAANYGTGIGYLGYLFITGFTYTLGFLYYRRLYVCIFPHAFNNVTIALM